MIYNETIDAIDIQWIKNKIKVHELQQSELAGDLNVSASHLSKWLNGKIGLARPIKALFYYYFIYLETSF